MAPDVSRRSSAAPAALALALALAPSFAFPDSAAARSGRAGRAKESVLLLKRQRQGTG